MEQQLLLPADFGDYAWEVESKGYFLDARVLIGSRHLAVSFYEPTRLAQDIAEELAAGRPFHATRLLVVASVTSESMRAALASAPLEFFE